MLTYQPSVSLVANLVNVHVTCQQLVSLYVLQSKGIWHTAQKAAENLNKAKHIIENDLDKVLMGVIKVI